MILSADGKSEMDSVRPEAARGLFPPPLLTPGGRFESADKPFRMDEL